MRSTDQDLEIWNGWKKAQQIEKPISQEYCLLMTTLGYFLKIFNCSLLVHGSSTSVKQISMFSVHF